MSDHLTARFIEFGQSVCSGLHRAPPRRIVYSFHSLIPMPATPIHLHFKLQSVKHSSYRHGVFLGQLVVVKHCCTHKIQRTTKGPVCVRPERIRVSNMVYFAADIFFSRVPMCHVCTTNVRWQRRLCRSTHQRLAVPTETGQAVAGPRYRSTHPSSFSYHDACSRSWSENTWEDHLVQAAQ